MTLTTHSLYFENAVGCISEYANHYAVVQYKPGKRKFVDFQTFGAHLRGLLQRRNWHKVLSDQRVLAPFTEEERAWIRAQWHTSVVQQKVLVAVLLPQDVFARLATSLVMHDAHEGALVYRIFQNDAEAATWLRQAL